jgi:hypothetical protein
MYKTRGTPSHSFLKLMKYSARIPATPMGRGDWSLWGQIFGVWIVQFNFGVINDFFAGAQIDFKDGVE